MTAFKAAPPSSTVAAAAGLASATVVAALAVAGSGNSSRSSSSLQKLWAHRWYIVLPSAVAQHPQQTFTDAVIAISQSYEVVVAAVQPGHQDCHVISFASRVDKIGNLNKSDQQGCF